MRLLAVAGKSLKEAVRQPKSLAITLGLPVVFMLIFGFAFGGGNGAEGFDVAILDQDEGELGAAYVAALDNLSREDGTDLVRVHLVEDRAAGTRLVEDRDVVAFVVLPRDLTANLTWQEVEAGDEGGLPVNQQQQPPQRVPPPGVDIELVGDPSWPAFSSGVRLVDAFSAGFAAEATEQPPPSRITTTSVASQELTDFDFIAPGLMVFAILNIIPQAATVLAREEETHTLDRIRLSPLPVSHFLGGVGVAQVALAVVSVAFMFVAAEAMGFHNQGSWWQGPLLALLVVPSVVGVALIIAAFSARQEEAANLGALVAVPVSFLSGAFFPLPEVPLFTWSGRVIGLYDLLPSTHAVDGLRAHLTLGTPLPALTFEMTALAGLALVYFTVGVVLFRRARLTRG